MKKRKEDLPLSPELVERFIQINKKQWTPVEHTDKYILINFSMVRMQVAWIIPKLLYAKGIEDEIGAKPVAFTWKENALLTGLIESFGIKHIALDDINRKKIWPCIKALFKTFSFLAFDGTGEGLKNLRICKINAGKPLYEDILRTSSLSTIKSARNKICMKKIFHLLWTAYAMDDWCRKHKVSFVVCDDMAYHEGLFLQLFHRHGAEIYNVSSRGNNKIIFREDSIIRSGEIKKRRYDKFINQLDESSVQWSERYLQERYQGKNGRSIDRGAFLGKKVLSRDEIIKDQGLDPNKKNVVIMAHTFTDAVFNYGDIYFRDYYDWTEQTLKIAQEVDTVNWILKPHPTRGAYNESKDSIEKMYERYKKSNIYFLSDDISAESIKNIADVLITIGGNAGAEFACEGIPAVIVGKPYYYGFGYTIEPKNRKEYEDCLRKVDQIKHLSEDQIKMAKKVFYLGNSDFVKSIKPSYNDEFSVLINNAYGRMVDDMGLRYFASNEGSKEYNNDLLKLMIEYFDKNDMKQCDYYKCGVSCAKNTR